MLGTLLTLLLGSRAVMQRRVHLVWSVGSSVNRSYLSGDATCHSVASTDSSCAPGYAVLMPLIVHSQPLKAAVTGVMQLLQQGQVQRPCGFTRSRQVKPAG